jgi:long-chain acyl-CoA synthetase
MQDLAEARPTVMPAVPRVFEKVHTRVLAGLQEASPLRRRAFAAAMDTGRQVSRLRQKGKEPTGLLLARWKVAERLVFSKIHALFGGRIRAFVSGGAPLSKELAEFFHAMGLLVLEGYGMTENCAAATVNRPDRFKFGTVGLPLDGVEVRIAPDGEVLLRGRNLMQGY